jgi:hypothetical protein
MNRRFVVIVVCVIGGVILLAVAAGVSSAQQPDLDHFVYLPIVAKPPCLTYKATMWFEAPSRIQGGQQFTTTIALQNSGCSVLGMPIYAIHGEPGINNPPPYQKLVSIDVGQVDRHTFTLTAPITAPLTITLAGGATFEVGYPPPGGFGYGNAAAPAITIFVEE